MHAAAAQMKENVCGRVIAMLAQKEDAPREALADLVRAVEEPPVVLPKPTVRMDLCIAMLAVGALVVLLVLHMWDGTTSPCAAECAEEEV